MANQGIFIALEGVDGSGKGTQFNLLAERLRAVGHEVETFDFPRYEEPSSYFVRRYLNGEYGPAGEISPYSAALFYALDRFEAAPAIRKALDAGKVVLSNRYTGSSMAHQGSKFGTEAEQRGFFIWVESLEYQLLNIPRPNVSIFLRVPAEVSFGLIEQKRQRSYTSKKRDEHEADLGHLQRSVAAYDTLCRLFPKDFLAIECASGEQILPIPVINNLIWQTIRYFLPPSAPNKARAKTVKLDGNARTDKKVVKEDAPAPEVATNSLPDVSLLALVELAKYGVKIPGTAELFELETSHNYYRPGRLDPKAQKRYDSALKQLLKRRESLRNILNSKKGSDANRILAAITPMAVQVPVNIAPDELIKGANQSGLDELRRFDKSPAKAATKNKTIGKLENLLLERMNPNQSTSLEPLTLLEFWPRNEFEILGSGLYGLSDLPRQEVQAELETWTYEQKYQALTEFLAQIDPVTAAQVRYSWDVIAPQSLLIELAETGFMQNLQVQTPTPRYGYEVPSSIEEAGLSDDFIDCFDLSLRLYSELQASGQEELAPYTTLAGHKTRFQFSCNLNDLNRLAGNQSAAVRSFRDNLVNRLGEAQPIVGDYLRAKPKKDMPKPATKSKRPRHRRSKK